ncbi:hypothetical protein V8C86DRAFT_2516394 [Haematococcus lacustris]
MAWQPVYRPTCHQHSRLTRSRPWRSIGCNISRTATKHEATAVSRANLLLDIPVPLLRRISQANREWQHAALQQPLVEPGHALPGRAGPTAPYSLHLVGVATYAPLQAELVTAVLDQMRPHALALDLPPGAAGSSVLLPYPPLIQLLMDNSDLLAALHQYLLEAAEEQQPEQQQHGNSTKDRLGASTAHSRHDPRPRFIPGSSSSSSSGDVNGSDEVEGVTGVTGSWTARGLRASPALAALIGELQAEGLALCGSVGRDIFDPYEALGYYSGLELLLQPGHVAAALQLFGYAPGAELAAAAEHGLGLTPGSCCRHLDCLDAPLRLQEVWVAQQVAQFRLQETDLPRQLQQELRALQAWLPPGHAAWERAVGRAVAGRGVTATESMAAYKVVKACAAACLGPDIRASGPAMEGQARLQPMKWALLRKRALHLARQLLERARRYTAQARVQEEEEAVEVREEEKEGDEGSRGSGAGTSPVRLVAVVGRQMVPFIRELWNDQESALWQGDVPRTFSPSMVEPVARERGDIDPDTNSGGSRPVGQKPLDLDSLIKPAQPTKEGKVGSATENIPAHVKRLLEKRSKLS